MLEGEERLEKPQGDVEPGSACWELPQRGMHSLGTVLEGGHRPEKPPGDVAPGSTWRELPARFPLVFWIHFVILPGEHPGRSAETRRVIPGGFRHCPL